MTKIHVGIIAEDPSDVEVLKELGRKISGRNFSVSQHFGKGCGPLKSKTPGWCRALRAKGCDAVVLVHDRDRKDAKRLLSELEAVIASTEIDRGYVSIPSEELEAWLLSDTAAITRALKLDSEPKAVLHPETVSSPKEFLGDLVASHSKRKSKVYVNTEHNCLIAREISVAQIDSKCPSFRSFRNFVEAEIGKEKKQQPKGVDRPQTKVNTLVVMER